MGIPMVALAKLNLLLSKSHTGTSLITCLLCPYVLKLTFSVRLVRQAYTDLLYSSRLFLFQLSQIAFDADQPAAPAGNSTRLGRALRGRDVAPVIQIHQVGSNMLENVITERMLSENTVVPLTVIDKCKGAIIRAQ
ncbi:hypothetical protein POTOM_001298 [Populus tomentosa]|uniref:Uncharacterized protein n=1 Tax=Populus tomentosa TaxID=118781 RepID=A0A8X8DHN6_POPTO|nr:hypothetical protein POTOM_001298 [Populus tomentosa]